MNKTPKPYLQDILEAIDKIELYLNYGNLTQTQFNHDLKTQDAIIRRLEIIGEATRRLKTSFHRQYNQIPWRQMSDLRNVLIHEYDQIDLDQVWLVITQDLKILKPKIKQILQDLTPKT